MVNEKYQLWCEKAVADPDLVKELESMKDDGAAISDAFYKDLEFGTGGLRGVIGAGTNRMNIYTVGKASQGLAAYVNSVKQNGKIAVAYDSRIKSELFARTAASVFAANGIKVYIYKELMPTPMLSYAVRRLGCDAGVVVTASHNPAKYNGYKAYGPDGCQLGLEAADYVLSIMNKVDIFDEVKTVDFDTAVKNGSIEFIGDDVIEDYLNCVLACRVAPEADVKSLKVIYTPLHGSGNKPVRSILRKIGVKNVTVVPEQEMPNGNFPTAPYPNPEIRQAFECALKLAETVKPDLLLATDPDCDRVGIAVNTGDDYKLLSGNDVGALLLDFVLSRRKANGTLPKKPIAVKTIVTTELCRKIAADYGCELRDITRYCDSFTICLSKGLGAPVGSLLVGSEEYIRRAIRWRKMVGGGMRQAGILAAAGLYALQNNVARLKEDHDNAAWMAEQLRAVGADVMRHDTNMLFVRVGEARATALGEYLRERGVLINASPIVRLVTHIDVNRQQLAEVVSHWQAFLNR